MTAPLPIQADDEGRWCSRCGLSKSPLAFGTRTRRGKTTSQPYCRDCMVAYHRDWRATPEGAAKFADRIAASRARYPERQRARDILQSAITSRRIVRGECEFAGADCRGTIDGHHDDYTRPLDVRWVCRRHHRALDKSRRLSLGAGQ